MKKPTLIFVSPEERDDLTEEEERQDGYESWLLCLAELRKRLLEKREVEDEQH